jgi:small multidrug resistance pump
MGWLFLLLAIVLEFSGTVSMKLSNGFARWLPSMLMFIFYGASFTLLNYSLKYMKISIVYATWSGIGIVLISLAGALLFQEKLSVPSILWMLIIVVGVVGLNMSIKGG